MGIRNIPEKDFVGNRNNLATKIKKGSDSLTKEINLHTCHGIKDRLISRFIKFRLNILAKQMTKKLEEKRVNRPKCGSKEIGMRDAVKHFK